MSGLSKLCLNFGAKVQGSDTGNSPEIEKLAKLGIKINFTHIAENITKEIDLVVYTSAISTKNPEYQKAIELKIPTMERSEFLGEIAKLYEKVIAVSGTHGKTTTTAMIGEICVEAGLNPTIHLGGESNRLKGNTIIGDNKLFIVEACEYKESFRYLKPTVSVITNIELDHLDYYKDYSSIKSAFQKFATSSANIIISKDCDIVHNNITTIFGDWEIKNLEFIGGGYNFNVYKKGVFYETFRINMLGYHNVINSLFAIAVADKIGIDKSVIVKALAGFMGVERRYETIFIFPNDCRCIIDYAHHYTEIENSIKGINDIYKKTLVIFQPHTYSRTAKLFDEFVETLSKIDDIVIFKTYPAREDVIKGGTAEDLFNGIHSKNKTYFDDEDELISYISKQSKNYECVLVLGAGDLAEYLKRKFRNYIN